MDKQKEKKLLNAETANLTPEQFSEKFTVPATGMNFYDKLEWSLMFLSFKDTMFELTEAKRPFNIKTFDGAWLLDAERLGANSDVAILNPDNTPVDPALFQNINLKTLSLNNDPDPNDSSRSKMVQLQQVRTVAYENRRHIDQAFKTVVEWRIGVLSNNEKWFLEQEAFGLHRKNDKIHPIPLSLNPKFFIPKELIGKYISDPEYKSTCDRVQMAYQLKMSEYYEWFVYFRENENSVGFKIPINPSASKDIFSLRETPESKRKKAICNFIKEHYRTIRNDDLNSNEIEVLVKSHFRGETKFNWRGLEVHIIPSEYERNRIKTRKKFIEV